jgi:chromosome condensin MukBEF ATPase and DNA-binding subunit MukB
MVSNTVIGGIVGAVLGGAVGHQFGYDTGFRAGYNQAKWEMEQELNAMRAEVADQMRQMQAQINQLGRVGASHDERMTRVEQLLERLLSTLQAEALEGR